jgi:predicted transcriptional regulator
MGESIVELAKELTLALIQRGNVSPEDLQATLQKTYTTLRALKVQEESATSAPVPLADASLVNWRKSIARLTITCLECGHQGRQLTNRHLMTHGLDARSYRIKYGMPRTQPLTSRSTTQRRQQIIQTARPWEKAPAYLKAQARDGHASPEPEAAGRSEEVEEPSAPAQPKRQRKTSPKQSARKKQVAG